jgi:hypothetical protein
MGRDDGEVMTHRLILVGSYKGDVERMDFNTTI